MPTESPTQETVGFTRHDHSNCRTEALQAADAHCREAGLRFTPVRRRSLEILLEEHRAMGAYEVLERLQQEGLGAQPPAAYRALDFLVANGFVHRIEHLNAFVACTHPGESHVPAFLICRRCQRVAETIALPDVGALASTAASVGFDVERILVEAEGLCETCRSVPAP